MPGYIIHLAEGEKIFSELKKKINLDEKWRDEFLTGCLLPDTRTTGDKRKTHFWNENIIPELARKPDLKLFLKKYRNQLDTPIVGGYYAHLILDVHFIDIYWADEFYFMDKDFKPEHLFNKVEYVKIKKTGETVKIKDFLSIAYYYGDYSKTNEYYIQKYNIEFPKRQRYINPIEEADINEMQGIYENLDKYCTNGKLEDVDTIKVFDMEKLDNLIDNSVLEFVEMYNNNFEKIVGE